MRLFTKLFTAVTLTLGLVMAVAGTANANDRYGKQKVVYHINYNGGEDDKAYRGALTNIQNHINAVGVENIEIKVVLHGNGLGLLANAKSNELLRGQVLSLKGQNVEINVCNNTLKGRKISYENDLFDVFKEDIVPSGVAELSYLQQKGYTYIKP
ncbi:DsrE family protein [Hoeflea sp.]|uniref:DsrE family protein n=1 Tax=Hoeflea sp. TaxID=1940281 RepID=UPI0019884EDB|nr:DsrE family protein [Hoeflea sp.]MBC7281281.1 DsrE family protein [Hoeflea sp.]